jgi:hypothetical protein
MNPQTPKINGTVNYWCTSAECVKDLDLICPEELKKENSKGDVIGCLSACEKFKTDQYCCTGIKLFQSKFLKNFDRKL